MRSHDTFPADAPLPIRLRHLLEYAVLAPSSHNSQPWRFRVVADHVDVFADDTRWLRVADADQRELFVSVGCAIENLLVAAAHFGIATAVALFPEGAGSLLAARVAAAGVDLDGPRTGRELFMALRPRHTNRERYDGQPLTTAELDALLACEIDDEVQIVATGDEASRRRLDELNVRADALQFADPAWRHELGRWIGMGAFGQGWLVAKLAQLAVSYLDFGKSTARRDHDVLMSAPVLGVIATRADGRTLRVRAGQVFERLWLTAQATGLALHPMNQALQIPALREEVTAMLPGPSTCPQIVFRIGHGPRSDEQSTRRPLEEVILPA